MEMKYKNDFENCSNGTKKEMEKKILGWNFFSAEKIIKMKHLILNVLKEIQQQKIHLIPSVNYS